MKTISETDSLDKLILSMEKKNTEDLLLLRDQFHVTYESLKPLNLVKNVFHDITTSPEIKNNVVSNVIGLGTGIATKKLLMGNSHNPIKKVLGTVLEFAVANLVSKHSDGIKTIGSSLLGRMFKSKKD